jgi:histidine ammonia-lyase
MADQRRGGFGASQRESRTEAPRLDSPSGGTLLFADASLKKRRFTLEKDMNPADSSAEFIVGSGPVSVRDVVRVARDPHVRLGLSDDARLRVERSRAWIESQLEAENRMIYGVNTGFGSKASVRVRSGDLKALQDNLIRSHSAGVGPPFDPDVVRAAMFLLVNSLSRGHSGVRPVLIERLIDLLNAWISPLVPRQGSMGASGDLAPLAHLALVLAKGPDREIRDLQVLVYDQERENWEVQEARETLRSRGIESVEMEAKEGLALINGTHFSTALACLAVHEAQILSVTADIAAAISMEGLLAQPSALDPRLHDVRPHPGQTDTAWNLRKLVKGSGLLGSIERKVQDAYSLRCTPQVHGAVKDALRWVSDVVSIELNAVTDNPLIFTDEDGRGVALSGGNFHAEPLAIASDLLSISATELGSISERRVNRLMDRVLNEGLPSFLTERSGLESGWMMGQYTAASLVSENKALSHPASVDSIPVSEQQEDHVSMAPVAARKAREILRNVARILAIELLSGAQAIDLRRERSEGKPGRGIELAFSRIREEVEPLTRDRVLSEDIERIARIVESGALLSAVEEGLGEPLRTGGEPGSK